MNRPVRRLCAEGAIALGVCAAAYAAVVRPVERELAEVSAKYLTLVSQGTRPIGDYSPAQLETVRVETLRRSTELVRHGESVRDESLMFAEVMALASRHDVRVDQVRPAATARDPQPAAAVNAVSAATAIPRDTKAAYTLSVAGTYAGLAAFIEGLSAGSGFSVVNSVRLTPDDGDRHHPIAAQIDADRYAFDLSSIPAGPTADAASGGKGTP